ncbi:MAG: hypothetical protein ACK40X_09760 [Armatimonadota bacterium]
MQVDDLHRQQGSETVAEQKFLSGTGKLVMNARRRKRKIPSLSRHSIFADFSGIMNVTLSKEANRRCDAVSP